MRFRYTGSAYKRGGSFISGFGVYLHKELMFRG